MPFRQWASATALSAACALAHAAVLTVQSPLTDALHIAQPGAIELDKVTAATRLEGGSFTLQSATEAASVAEREQQRSLLAEPAMSRGAGRVFALSGSSDREGHGSLEPSLWQLSRHVHALQRGDHFEKLRGEFEWHHKRKHDDEVASVPLPGAAWLFVMGLLGLVGSRMTRVAGEREESNLLKPDPAMRGALPV